MSDLGGFSMFELFRQEVTTHAKSLGGLLDDLEDENRDAVAAESAMHAAHSLKGAARIIGIEPAEKMAGIMETYFEAARTGSLRLSASAIGAFREALEFLRQFADLSEDEAKNPSPELLAEANRVERALSAVLAGETEPAPPPPPTGSPSGTAPDLGDLSLMDLFKVELESQAAQLNANLLELEGDLSNPQKIEPVMRAAHSIKGASRIVGMDALTELAHVLEDALVAAQEGKLALDEDHLDVFFRTADVFSRLPTLSGGEIAAWPSENAGLLRELHDSIEAIAKGASAAAPAPPPVAEPRPPLAEQPPPPPEPATPPPAPDKPAPPAAPVKKVHHDGVVRVSAENLNRLMSFSAESLVQSRRLQPLSNTVMEHKRMHLRMADLIDHMQNEVVKLPHGGALAALIREASDRNDTGLRAVADHQDNLDSFAQQTTLLSERLYREVIASRMRPFADVADGFRRQVRDISRSVGKKARLEIVGRSTPVDRDILEDLQAPLNHILRNALDHGIETPEQRLAAGKPETGRILVEVRHHAGMLLIEASDDGQGIDLDKLRRRVVDRGLASEEMVASLTQAELLEFPFLPGFSTAAQVTEVSGRGVGLDVVQTMVRDAGGSVRLSTRPGRGTTAHLNLPITRSVLRTLVVEIDGESYAFPLTGVRRCLIVPADALQASEGRQYVVDDDRNIGLVSAREALELGEGSPESDAVHVVVLGDKETLYGLEVDRFVAQHDLVIRPLDSRLGKVANISSAALLDDGSPVLIVDIDDLIQTIDNLLAGGRLGRACRRPGKVEAVRRKTVLVVDDSITVRETERKLLENRGYAVDVAVDGVDGWNAVRLGSYDLVISDVDMPRMTGIELVRKIKQDPRLKPIPVMIVSYKDREEDRLAGLDAGANYYLTKSSFKDEALLDAVADLIGGPEE